MLSIPISPNRLERFLRMCMTFCVSASPASLNRTQAAMKFGMKWRASWKRHEQTGETSRPLLYACPNVCRAASRALRNVLRFTCLGEAYAGLRQQSGAKEIKHLDSSLPSSFSLSFCLSSPLPMLLALALLPSSPLLKWLLTEPHPGLSVFDFIVCLNPTQSQRQGVCPRRDQGGTWYYSPSSIRPSDCR